MTYEAHVAAALLPYEHTIDRDIEIRLNPIILTKHNQWDHMGKAWEASGCTEPGGEWFDAERNGVKYGVALDYGADTTDSPSYSYTGDGVIPDIAAPAIEHALTDGQLNAYHQRIRDKRGLAEQVSLQVPVQGVGKFSVRGKTIAWRDQYGRLRLGPNTQEAKTALVEANFTEDNAPFGIFTPNDNEVPVTKGRDNQDDRLDYGWETVVDFWSKQKQPSSQHQLPETSVMPVTDLPTRVVGTVAAAKTIAMQQSVEQRESDATPQPSMHEILTTALNALQLNGASPEATAEVLKLKGKSAGLPMGRKSAEMTSILLRPEADGLSPQAVQEALTALRAQQLQIADALAAFEANEQLPGYRY